ncbi:MAG: transglycosylase domain-containing protein [Anaerolinea sp.]|nr:transglycosylase domain-containing protein [Anaerolinea sp.]
MSSSVVHIIRRRKNRAQRKAHRDTQRRIWSILIGAALVILVGIPGGAAVGGAAFLYMNATANLPDPGENPFAVNGTTTFYDRTGDTLIYTASSSDRPWVALDTLPPYVIAATLVSEDPDFLVTPPPGIETVFVKLWQNVLIATLAPDSTITGRLVRNAILSNSGSLVDQRTREIALVGEINRRYSAETILEWHLNTNDYANEAFGIEAAAQTYFGKRSVDLTLDEAVMLAAIPTAAQYNPFDDETAARGRQADLLRRMRDLNAISQAQYEAAASVQTVIARRGINAPVAPDFIAFARRQAEAILTGLGMDGRQMVARGDLRIVTTLDLDLYNQSACVLETQIARLNATPAPAGDCLAVAYLPRMESRPTGAAPDSGALMLLDAQTGEILTLIGAVTLVDHQPGVTLQPFVYLQGFLGSYTPATMVYDVPNSYPGAEQGLIYTFTNPDDAFRGVMNLRAAMGAWLVPPAASLAHQRGMTNILRTAHQLGLNSLDENRSDILLLERGGAVSVLDIAYSYSVFASLGGMRGIPVEPVARGFRARDPAAVLRIEEANGGVLWAYDREEAIRCGTLDVCTPLLEDKLAYLVNDILADQETRWTTLGQQNPLALSRPGAVVNGVTTDGLDNWTVGYTPQIVAGVHLGRADGAAMGLDPYGMTGAAPVWRALMEYAHARANLPATGWERPETIIEMQVCEKSGLLPNGVCPVERELFIDGTQPRAVDSYWQTVEINNQTGQRATVNTPPESRSEVLYFVPPDAAREWWVANNQPLPPTEYDNVSVPQVFELVRLTRPQFFDYVGGQVEIYAEINTQNMGYFQVQYGQGLSPSVWIDIGGQQTSFDPTVPVATWDTSELDGLYSLRLIMVQTDSSRSSDSLQVTVDNVAPAVTLQSVEVGKVYRFPGDAVVALQADARDNLIIERVEFYQNGVFLGADAEAPYGFEWQIDAPGTQTFTAFAFDAVGNQSSSQLTVEILRAGS